MYITGKSPNTDNKSSVSLIKLSAFPQSVFSLCLSNVRVHIFYLRKSINLLLFKRHISDAVYSVLHYLIQQSVCLCPTEGKNKKCAWWACGMVGKLVLYGESDALKCVCHPYHTEKYSRNCSTWYPSLLNHFSVMDKSSKHLTASRFVSLYYSVIDIVDIGIIYNPLSCGLTA